VGLLVSFLCASFVFVCGLVGFLFSFCTFFFFWGVPSWPGLYFVSEVLLRCLVCVLCLFGIVGGDAERRELFCHNVLFNPLSSVFCHCCA